ncbi:hypothetical protein [Tatumella sp. JGM118]|nr:hypothetical protein [Tatumella sp. JGM118]
MITERRLTRASAGRHHSGDDAYLRDAETAAIRGFLSREWSATA